MRDESLETHRNWCSQFLKDALGAKTEDTLRFALASVQSAVAIYEIAWEHAKDKEKVDHFGAMRLPHLELLRDLRAQTFHRRIVPGLIASEDLSFTWSGPVKIGTGTLSTGSASVSLTECGPLVKLEGGNVKRKVGGSARDITVMDGKLFDQDAGLWIGLTGAIENYLEQIPKFLDACRPFLSEAPEPRRKIPPE